MSQAVLDGKITDREKTAAVMVMVLNFCCSLVFNFLPMFFGSDFVWYTVDVAEGICLVVGIALWKGSEKNGIIYK